MVMWPLKPGTHGGKLSCAPIKKSIQIWAATSETGLQSFRPGPTQTSHSLWLEAWNFGYGKQREWRKQRRWSAPQSWSASLFSKMQKSGFLTSQLISTWTQVWYRRAELAHNGFTGRAMSVQWMFEASPNKRCQVAFTKFNALTIYINLKFMIYWWYI